MCYTAMLEKWKNLSCIQAERRISPTVIISINLLVQKHDRVTCATKQIERDSKDSDATNSYPEKVQIKLVCNTLQK